MKNKSLLLTVALMALAGCHKAPSELRVLSPIGAPAVALFHLAGKDSFTTTSDPAGALIPMFKTDKYDIIVAPTKGGLAQIKQGAEFKIAATITFGNLYIVSTETDEDETLNEGDKVLVFQENDIPGQTFKYLYGDLGLDVRYVDGVDLTKKAIEDGGVLDRVQYDYIFTAEPVVTSTSTPVFIDVQEAFRVKSGGKEITQASVFVRNGVDAHSFLTTLEASIKAGLEDPNIIQDYISKVGSMQEQQGFFGVPGVMAKKVTLKNGFSLGYKKAIDIKEDIESFVNLLTNNTYGTLDEEIIYQ